MTPEEFAAMANADDTVPVPANDDWKTDAALRRIERQMIREENNPTGFAAFCQAILAVGITDAAIKLFIELGGVINGLRRVKPCDKGAVRRLFEETRVAIDALPDGPRKERLDGLWDYNAGIFARENGEYDLAARSQESGAKKAEQAGNKEGAAICAFSATVEWVNHAMVTGQGLAQAIQRLLDQRNDMADVSPTSNEYHWVTLNAPVHRITATFWAGMQYNQLDADIQTLRQLHTDDPNLAQAHEATIAMCAAINSLAKGDMEHAINLAQSVIDGHGDKVHPDYLATAHLVLARIALSRISGHGGSHQENAHSQYEAIINLRQESSHQVRAVARRELTGIKGTDSADY